MSTSSTPLHSLGKFQLIDRLTQDFVSRQPNTILSIGDDAALLDALPGTYAVLSTELLLEGVHFDLTYHPLKHLGYKAVVVALSDIVAMNAVPQQLMVGVALSNRFSLETVQALYEGIYAACEFYEIDLIGGDTCPSRGGLTISVTAIGQVAKEKVCRRDGARPGDLLCVTGDLGAAYLGLQILSREKKIFQDDPHIKPDLAPYSYLVQRQLKPEARVDIIRFLDKVQVLPTAMIDISDGLASELLHLGRASKVGVEIYEEKLPVHPLVKETAEELRIASAVCACNGGEDYELLFTIDPAFREVVEENAVITIIGRVTAAVNDFHLVTEKGNSIPLEAQGWSPLSGTVAQ